VEGTGTTQVATSAPSELLVALPATELMKLGLVANRSMALVAVVIGLAWELDLLSFTGIEWKGWLPAVISLLGFGAFAAITLVMAGIVCTLLLLFSIVWTLVRFHGFRLERSGDDLRMTCGLLTRHSATIPRRRVQFVSVRTSPAHRLFDRVSISVETAGGVGGGNQDETAASRKWFVPILPSYELPRLLTALEVPLDFDAAFWLPLAPRARRRMLRKLTVVSLLVSVPFVLIFWPYGLMSLVVLMPLAWWYAVKAVEYMSYAKTEEGLMFRSGVWTQRMSGTFFNKVQVVGRSQSPFDRRWRMATMSVDTAGAGPAEHKIKVPYLEAPVAESLAGEIYARTERSTFRWA
jgi:putative membrane protein